MATPEKRTLKKVIDPELTLRYLSYIKNAFAFVLATAFENECTPDRFRYDFKDADKRQIVIYRGLPKRVTMLPMLTVDGGAGDASFKTLGDETGFEIKDEKGANPNLVLGKVFRGTMTLGITINIWAKTITDRDQLVDLVTIYMRHLFYGVFLANNVPFLQITPAELPPDVRDGLRIHRGSVTTLVQTEAHQFIDQTMLDAFTDMNLNEVTFGSSEDDQQNNNTV